MGKVHGFIPVNPVQRDRKRAGWHPARSIKDMGREIAICHGVGLSLVVLVQDRGGTYRVNGCHARWALSFIKENARPIRFCFDPRIILGLYGCHK
jgi:hypothetical protein